MSDLYERRNGRADRIDRFFAGPGARGDQWRTLVELAEAWSNGSGNRTEFEAVVAEMMATEEFHAFPGPQLMTALRDHAASNDAHATAILARRITRALLTRSFRQHATDWDAHEDSPHATALRRVFYAVEELLELHLAILEGVQDRYDTPFFNNLKTYAQRSIGTFHALPCRAR